MMLSILTFLLAMGIILGGAAVFTNGVEWLGRRLGISDGAIGSILAGIATALPETLIPVIAIFFGTSQTEADIGVGAILGAPLMLGALVLPMLAGFLLLLARMRKRPDFMLGCFASTPRARRSSMSSRRPRWMANTARR